jgi:uncharacterized protein (TIGR04255 family)
VSIRLPPVELQHLSRAPLRSVIAQLRFAPLLAVEQADQVARFQAALPDGFELAERTFAQSLSVNVGPGGLALAGPEPPGTVWHFRSSEEPESVHLAVDSCALEVGSYHDWDRFSDRVARMIQSLDDVLKPKRLHRVGLRYINQIDDSRLEDRGALANFVRRELLGGLGDELGYDALSSFAELRLLQPDGVFALRHGVVGPQSYLLDFDYFSEDEREFDRDAILGLLGQYHRVIESVFIWTLGESYRRELQEAQR